MPLLNVDNPSICILRLSAIGDVTHAIALVKTLQANYPKAKITWVIGKLEHKLLSGLPGVEFVVFDKSKGRQAAKDLKHHFRNTHFDVLLHIQVAFRANLLSRAIPAKLRIGFDKKRSRDFHGWFVDKRIPAKDQHVLDGFMEFAKIIGADKPVYEQDIPVSETDLAFAKTHLATDRPNVIISPCSSHKLRNWSVDGYARIAEYLIDKYNAKVLLCGSPSQFEKEMSAQIEKTCSRIVFNITGQDTLKQFYALLKGADLLITPDSGPAHMGSCAKTPTIALHATSIPRRCGPYNFQDLAVDAYSLAAQKFKQKDATQIKWGTKFEFPGAMDLISVEMVIEKIELWAQQYRREK